MYMYVYLLYVSNCSTYIYTHRRTCACINIYLFVYFIIDFSVCAYLA